MLIRVLVMVLSFLVYLGVVVYGFYIGSGAHVCVVAQALRIPVPYVSTSVTLYPCLGRPVVG